MLFVLDRSKEILRNLFVGIVVYGCCVAIRDLLVKITLRRANVANSLQKFLEIAIPTVFQPFIVKSKTLLNEFVQPAVAHRLNLVATGD